MKVIKRKKSPREKQNTEELQVSTDRDGNIVTKISSDIKDLKKEHTHICVAYRLISEGLHQGKNTYLITETLEGLQKMNEKMHKEIVKLTKGSDND